MFLNYQVCNCFCSQYSFRVLISSTFFAAFPCEDRRKHWTYRLRPRNSRQTSRPREACWASQNDPSPCRAWRKATEVPRGGDPKAPGVFPQPHTLRGSRASPCPAWSSESNWSPWEPMTVVCRHLVADSAPAPFIIPGISSMVTAARSKTGNNQDGALLHFRWG